MMEAIISLEISALIRDSVISQKTAFFKLTAEKTSYPA
jgi:hypothetical protein